MLTDQIERSPESSLTSNGIDLCYETFGRAGDVPIVLVMGLGAQMIMWPDDFCRQLAAQGRYVVRFDNRDVGRSTYIDEPNPPSMTDVFGAFADLYADYCGVHPGSAVFRGNFRTSSAHDAGALRDRFSGRVVHRARA